MSILLTSNIISFNHSPHVFGQYNSYCKITNLQLIIVSFKIPRHLITNFHIQSSQQKTKMTESFDLMYMLAETYHRKLWWGEVRKWRQMHNRNGLYGWQDAWDQTLTRTRLLTAACTAATGLVRSGMAFPSTSPSSCMITKWDICWATGSRILSIVLVWKTGILKSKYPQHKWEKEGTCSLQAMTLPCFPPLCFPRAPRSRCLFPSHARKRLELLTDRRLLCITKPMRPVSESEGTTWRNERLPTNRRKGFTPGSGSDWTRCFHSPPPPPYLWKELPLTTSCVQ